MSIQSSTLHTLSSRTLHRAVLDNGITVLAAENPAADIVSARLFLPCGGGCEPAEQAGIAHLLAALITKGTDRLSSQEIAEKIESVGASLGTDAAPDYFLLSLKAVSSDFADLLALAAEILRSPAFPQAEVELERRLTLQSIRSMQEQPFAVANLKLRQAMYGNHPYGLPSLGAEATVAAIERSDLQQFHQTHFRPDQLVISIVGRIIPEEAIALVDRCLGDWDRPRSATGEVLPTASTQFPPLPLQPQQVVTPQDTQQAIVMLGHLAPPVHHADHLALKLLTTYLGNGLSSRLFVELREKRGLAYEVSAFYPTRLDTSHFVVYMGTAPENTAIAQVGMQQELDRLCTTFLSDEELQTAKNKLLGQYALGKQSNAQLAQVFGWYEALGLGVEFDDRLPTQVEALTAEALHEVANRHFQDAYLSIVGPKAAISGAL